MLVSLSLREDVNLELKIEIHCWRYSMSHLFSQIN